MARIFLAVVLFLYIICTFNLFVNAFECRDGIENVAGYIYRKQKPCNGGENACFQSKKCEKIADTVFESYDWRCIDPSSCKNESSLFTAYYNGTKGVCCFKSNCNDYKMKNCTSRKGFSTSKGFSSKPVWKLVFVCLATVGYVFMKL